MAEQHVYAYVCPECRHLATKHLLIGEATAGPYRCPCGCERMQDAIWLGITRSQFELKAARQAPKEDR